MVLMAMSFGCLLAIRDRHLQGFIANHSPESSAEPVAAE